MRKTLFALAITVVMAPAMLAGNANAEPKRAVFNEVGGKVVRSTNGNCVRTKWSDSSDVCAPEAPPAPVVVAPPAPEPEPEPALKLTRDERTIYFDFNKSDLTAEATAKLDSIINAVVASKGVQKVVVVGYADQIGSNDYNLKLSQKRANAVEDYLDDKVTIPTEVKTVSAKGEEDPVTDCDPKQKRTELIKCLAADRRVEVQFVYAK